MRNFEILFACAGPDGSVVPYVRVIATSDICLARRIAYAMTGELISEDRSLDCMVYMIPTERIAHVPPTAQGYYHVWRRVFQRLGIDGKDVRLWYGSAIGTAAESYEPEIVGFFPWPEKSHDST